MDCCSTAQHGIACCEECAAALRQSYLIKQRQLQVYGIGVRPQLPASIFMYSLFGLILLIVGIYLSYTRPGIDYLTFAMSAVFLVMAAITYKRFRDNCTIC